MADQNEKVQKLYNFIDATTEELHSALGGSYTDSLSENLHNIMQGQTFVSNGAPDEATVNSLNKKYSDFKVSGYKFDEICQAIELSILKCEKNDNTEVNKMMTPDSVNIITSAVLNEIINVQNKQGISLVDPAVGTGNLLIRVLHEISVNNKTTIEASGMDNDDSLLDLADSYTEFTNQNIELLHQDSVANWQSNNYDYAISDLPVGYYPIDKNAERFQTKADEGHSYVHHLLMENTMSNLTEGGVGLFIVPAQIFQTDQAKKLSKWMVSDVYLQGVLNFPSDIFKTEDAQKSLVILQKPGSNAKKVEKVLMGGIPSLKNIEVFNKFQTEIKKWTQNNF